MQARPDILTLVSFITNHMLSPDEDNWGKLKRGLRHLKGTRHIKLNIKVDSLTTILWYVDESYSVHADCKVHTSMIMTLGARASMSLYKGHKINVKSYTELELVGINDSLPYIIWGK